MWRKSRGDKAEALALKWLQRQGLQLIDRNVELGVGEIDLLMRSGEALVVVEVRYRSDESYGGAAGSVTASKQAKLIAATRRWIAQHPKHADSVWRFDVLAISGDLRHPEYQWIKNAFDQ